MITYDDRKAYLITSHAMGWEYYGNELLRMKLKSQHDEINIHEIDCP